MDCILMREEPLFRKCCYVIPLRFCLQTWAFLKMIADFLAIGYVSLVILVIYGYAGIGYFTVMHLLILLVVALVVDVGFLVALTAGIFNKSIAIIRVFYFYEMYVMVVEASFIIFICVQIADAEMGLRAMIFIIVGILYILLDLCIIVTLKSEMVKLRNKNQYDFSRIEGEETGQGSCSGVKTRESTIVVNNVM